MKVLITGGSIISGDRMFIAYVNEASSGCDYTIACGKKLFELQAKTYDEAIEEIKCLFFDFLDQPSDCEGLYYFESELEEIILYEVSSKNTLPISDWYEKERRQKEDLKLKKQREAELEEYERLKEKFE